MENNIKNLLEDLKAQENIEEDLIQLYSELLSLGVENCLAADRIQGFHDNIETLKKESEMHKKVLEALINKYQ